jgi:hypothetical protein
LPPPGGVPGWDFGFPTADGTPVATPMITWFQLVGETFLITLFDPVSRALFTPPSIRASRLNLPMAAQPPVLLIGPFATDGRLALLDMLTGGIDPMPELPPVNSTAIFAGATMSAKGAVIAFATIEAKGDGAPVSRVQVFDRRSRQSNRLAKLNGHGPLIEPWIDLWGRFVAVTAVRPEGGRDVLLYDLITGLVDPLPAVNTAEPETFPSLSAGGRFLAFVRGEAANRRLFLYDRVTQGLDTLPDLDRLGPIVQGGIGPDGYTLSITLVGDGQLQRILYDRRTGMIDPLPELNPVGVNAFIDLERQGLLR